MRELADVSMNSEKQFSHKLYFFTVGILLIVLRSDGKSHPKRDELQVAPSDLGAESGAHFAPPQRRDLQRPAVEFLNDPFALQCDFQ